MFITIKRLFEWVLLLMFFFLMTILVYKFTIKFTTWMEPNQFKEPHGNSVKVAEIYPESSLDTINSGKEMIERIKVFYWIGE